MTEKLNRAGWVLACILFIVLALQKGCRKNKINGLNIIHDTITITGDRQLIKVQDTVFAPTKTVYIPIEDNFKIDTLAVLKDYFAERTYDDTIKSRDIIAVIRDSISGNKLAGRKVLLENKRDKQIINPESVLKNKVFVGGFMGISMQNMHPPLGLSVAFLSKKDRLFFYNYDVIRRSQAIGLYIKLHFGRK